VHRAAARVRTLPSARGRGRLNIVLTECVLTECVLTETSTEAAAVSAVCQQRTDTKPCRLPTLPPRHGRRATEHRDSRSDQRPSQWGCSALATPASRQQSTEPAAARNSYSGGGLAHWPPRRDQGPKPLVIWAQLHAAGSSLHWPCACMPDPSCLDRRNRRVYVA
jgi:hypothetical protein